MNFFITILSHLFYAIVGECLPMNTFSLIWIWHDDYRHYSKLSFHTIQFPSIVCNYYMLIGDFLFGSWDATATLKRKEYPLSINETRCAIIFKSLIQSYSTICIRCFIIIILLNQIWRQLPSIKVITRRISTESWWTTRWYNYLRSPLLFHTCQW